MMILTVDDSGVGSFLLEFVMTLQILQILSQPTTGPLCVASELVVFSEILVTGRYHES